MRSLLAPLTLAVLMPTVALGAPATPVAAPAARSIDPEDFSKPAYTYLWVSDAGSNQAEVFDSNYNLASTLTNGFNSPAGDWVDAKGNFYVANQAGCAGAGNVVEFAPHAKSPTYTYNAGMSCPLYVTSDPSGAHVFEFDYNGGANVINEYKKGKNKVIASWSTCPRTFFFCYPTGMSMGKSGQLLYDMYGFERTVDQYYWEIVELFYKQSGYNQFALTSYSGPSGGVAMDSKKNLFLSANPVPPSGSAKPVPVTGAWTVVEAPYPYHYDSSLLLVNLNYVGFVFTASLALSSKYIYVADPQGYDVTVLTYPDGYFVQSLSSGNGVTQPFGVALGPAP